MNEDVKGTRYSIVVNGIVYGIYDFSSSRNQTMAMFKLRQLRKEGVISELGETRILSGMEKAGYTSTKTERERIQGFRKDVAGFLERTKIDEIQDDENNEGRWAA